jgi:outer membrane protein assembly factor BamB
MRRTCFVCYGTEGKKNSLTYQEISRKSDGDEFFIFLSWSRASDEEPLRELYRSIVSSSRLGHPARFFREIAENAGESAGSWLEESCILMTWRKGEDVYLFRNKKVEPVHFDSATGREGTIHSLEDREELPLQKDGTQTDLFDKEYGDHFDLDRFRLSSGGHTLLFAPSRDFIRRNRETLLDSVLFPSFEVPAEGELEVNTDRSVAAMHWGTSPPAAEVPVRRKRGVEIMKSSVPMAAGAVALVLAILIIFKPFGNRDENPGGDEEVLLSTASSAEESVDDGISVSEDIPDTPAPSVSEEPAVSTRTELSEGWRKKFEAAVTSSPVICGDNVTFGCRDGNLYCFSTAGEIRWEYKASTGVGASPACAGNRVLGADYEGNVFCLSLSEGSRIWNYKAGAKIVSSPVISSKRVIVCTMDGRIISLDLSSGEREWSQKIGEQIWGTPSAGKDFIIVATTDGSLIRMTHDGKVTWRVEPGGRLHSSPLCIEDRDLVVIGTGDTYIIGYSLSAGMLMWRYGAGSDVRSSPVSSGGTIVVGTENGLLVAVSTDGQLIWKKDMGGAIRSRPLILDEMVAVTAYNSKLSVLSLYDGSVISEYRAASPIYSSPAYHDGRIFFGSNAGFFHAPELKVAGS